MCRKLGEAQITQAKHRFSDDPAACLQQCVDIAFTLEGHALQKKFHRTLSQASPGLDYSICARYRKFGRRHKYDRV